MKCRRALSLFSTAQVSRESTGSENPSMKWDVVYNALALQHQICCRNVHLHIEVEYNMAPQAYNVDLVNEPLVEG